jgi:hypothetical protein
MMIHDAQGYGGGRGMHGGHLGLETAFGWACEFERLVFLGCGRLRVKMVLANYMSVCNENGVVCGAIDTPWRRRDHS